MKKIALFCFALIVLSACQEHTGKSKAAFDNSMVTNDSSGGIDTLMYRGLMSNIIDRWDFGDDYKPISNQFAKADSISPSFIQKYDSIHLENSLKDYQKCLAMLAVIDSISKDDSDTEYSTMSMAMGLKTRLAICWYKTMVQTEAVLKYGEIEQKQRGLFLRETRAWLKFAETYGDFCFDIIDMQYFGGTIRKVLMPLSHLQMLQLRSECLTLYLKTDSALFNDYHESALPVVVSVKTMGSTLEHWLIECSDTSYIDFNGEAYLAELSQARKRIPEIKRNLNEWVAVREEISQLLDHDRNKPYQDETSRVIVELCKVLEFE